MKRKFIFYSLIDKHEGRIPFLYDDMNFMIKSIEQDLSDLKSTEQEIKKFWDIHHIVQIYSEVA